MVAVKHFPTRLVVGLGMALAAAPAYAAPCDPPSPECHLKNGEKLIKTDPKAAAAELLASYKLDERTDTLTLYAQAVQSDGQFGLALETWQRIILFRESEIDAAKEAKGKDKAKAAAKAKESQAKSEEAAGEIQKLWGKVGKVKITGLAGGTVTRVGGAEVDASKEILVTSGRDELVFVRADGTTKTLVVEVAPGATKTYDAPAGSDGAKLPTTTTTTTTTTTVENKSVIETSPEAEPISYTEHPRSKTMANVGLGIGAVGIAGLAVGTTFAIIGHSKYSEAKDLGCDGDGNCPTGAATRKANTANDNYRVGEIGLIGGGALVVTGAILYYVGHKSVRTESNVAVSLTPDSVGIGWSFQ